MRARQVIGLAALVLVDVVLVFFAFTAVSGARDTSDVGGRAPSAGHASPAASEVTPRPNARLPNVQLDAANDDVLLRARPGDCGRAPPRLELSVDRGRSFGQIESPVREILRINVESPSDIWLVGRGQQCTPHFYRSRDRGRSWSVVAETTGAWHVLGDVAALHAPGGRVKVGCRVRSLAPVDFDVAYVVCSDDRLRVTRDGGGSWRDAGQVRGVVQAAFRTPLTGVAVAASDACAARVWRTTDGGVSWRAVDCLDGPGSARAVAVHASTIVVEQGRRLVGSRDLGRTWSQIG